MNPETQRGILNCYRYPHQDYQRSFTCNPKRKKILRAKYIANSFQRFLIPILEHISFPYLELGQKSYLKRPISTSYRIFKCHLNIYYSNF